MELFSPFERLRSNRHVRLESELTEIGPASKALLESYRVCLRSGQFSDCLTIALHLAKLFLDEGKTPWIARFRKQEVANGRCFHSPLIPRTPGLTATWTTHYVCCLDGLAFDPLSNQPVPVEHFGVNIFGLQMLPDVFLNTTELVSSLDSSLSTRELRKRLNAYILEKSEVGESNRDRHGVRT